MRICASCGRQWAVSIERCPVDGTELPPPSIAQAEGQLAVAALPTEEGLAAGTVVGEYTIEKQIGEGGMGVVYAARHPVIGKQAAIKVLHARLSTDREGVARFIQEAQAVNQIGHANIVDVFSFGTLADGRAYFVMELLLGDNLQNLIDKGPLPIPDVIAIIASLARALEAAHTAGVIHRDLKPDNVILVPDEESFRVKLLDFGIAKLQTSKPLASKTATGQTVGTPLFMSPEQARGLELDGRTDIYSLGVLGYAMVCGKSPFEDEPSPVEILHAHLKRIPTPPRDLRSETPPVLEALIQQMLAKQPDQRPTLVEIRRRLSSLQLRSQPIAAQAVDGETDDAISTMQAPRRRTGLLVAGGAVVAIAGGALAFFMLRGGSADSDAKPAPPAVASPSPSPSPTPSPSPSPTPSPAPPTTATLDVSLEPTTATVSLDSHPAALDHGRLVAELSPGAHVLAVRAPGYRATEKKLDVTAGNPIQLSIHLERAHASRPVAHDTDAVVNPFKKK